MQYLMTHSLLTAWLYHLRDNPFADMNTEDRSREDFLKVLRREPTETTPAMQDGIDFEDMVTAILEGRIPETAGDNTEEAGTTGTDAAPEAGTTMTHPEWLGAARKVAEMLQGCQLQVTATKPMTIRGMELLLKGRLDALRGGSIYDIKFSKNYTRGKYQDSTQHPMYFRLVDGAMYFTYIISNGTEVWTEQYGFDEAENLNLIIEYFLDWLEEHRLIETYKNCWQVKPG